jgi:uncharacterized membrane protein YphA (DoxX/SURF4 family)
MSLMGRHLASIIRIGLGTVFIYAGALKATTIVAFAGNIAAYQLLPYTANYVVAAVLPWLEIICGLLLIVGIRIRAASALIILLNAVFIVALSAALIRGLDIDCGCFKQGGAGKTTAWQALLRDLVLLAMAITVYCKSATSKHQA